MSPNFMNTRRLTALMSGLFSVWIAAGSPLATLDHQSLTVHMLNHLLLMTVAAPLILAGMPILRNARLMHPVLCWLAGTATVIGWHVPAAFELALQSHWAHGVEAASFLLAGLLFWSPVIQPLSSATMSPRWSMVLYLFLATLPCDVLSAFLAFCNRLVYPHYSYATQLLSFSPLQDQQSAGALMWVWVTFAYLIPAVIITMQILSVRDEDVHLSAQEEAL
jgi:putative membrane protein